MTLATSEWDFPVPTRVEVMWKIEARHTPICVHVVGILQLAAFGTETSGAGNVYRFRPRVVDKVREAARKPLFQANFQRIELALTNALVIIGRADVGVGLA